jgi:hypothetical protein
MTRGVLVVARRSTQWAIIASFALAVAWPLATGGAAATGTGAVPEKLLGVWHKTMTRAEWDRAGVYREAGRYTFLIKKAGTVTVYLPGDYRTSCRSSCSEDFTTTFRPSGDRVTLGSVPVCSFKGLYGWHLLEKTLVVRPVADTKCVVRVAFFGGRRQR